MTDKNAIKVVSGLLLHQPLPQSNQDGEVNAIIEKYPYFIPARYIKAKLAHGQKPFSSEMLTNVYPYRGNWLMFLDHIQGIRKPVAVVQEAEPIEEISLVEDQIPVGEIEEVIEPVVESEPIDVAALLVVQNDEDLLTEDEVDEEIIIAEEEMLPISVIEMKEEDIFTPPQSDDYFMQQGIKISGEMPGDLGELVSTHEEDEEDARKKSLMVVMSFTEWLMHFKTTAEKKNAELEDQKAVRSMWQREKLSAALEEENDEIPENVFEMAVNSITREEGLASESLADIYLKQGKYDQAIEMYKKLSLRNPQKNAYFARKIEEILKEKRT